MGNKPIDFVRRGFVHERWADLPDTSLIATCSSGHAATELAKAMARRAAPQQTYVVTDVDTGEQFVWSRDRVEAHDNPETAA